MNRPTDFGDRFLVVRVPRDGPGGGLSMRVSRRTLAACMSMLLLILLFVVMSMTSGDYGIPLSDVARALTGQGDETLKMIVLEWRLPRALLAVLLGAALGISGAIFQSLTRNPLGSPDIIGFSTGAHTGALVAMLAMSGGYYETATGALIGGMATAIAVYLLTYRQGVEGFRLIVVGIAIAAMLSAANVWMIRQAELQVAMSAAMWAAGSLNGLGWERLLPVGLALSLLVPSALALSRPLRQLELGDDAATASGVSPNHVRLLLAIVGVALIALATAAAGPIAFIALAAPQLARRSARTAGIALMPSALMGGLLLLAGDWAAQHALGFELPVGVMTFNIGGLYFIWLLTREGRK
ncbi:iron chelate uptake ABC transporter family permease subunit [Phyllobacterium sp. 0TCS1.6C]|uniref:FecCD family ABC transporter permease n=1 Tax=unclassified Phyllobacterium TaxID=2638441 RepID=UPI002264E6BA|nr:MULTISPECIES: iron chelate uptake ABC transporter family permease subunit [unclassified Phyllobacterium]MCX8282100.1 iron chelate uptake ABC transporter family permease subunit [Phyllobacterium sp. 0TCS1.6C]MCX8296308.1 iron chelate uptake ABC transporter family permease subunit [Phyllobacterium sp. 0TCS1.6A]